MTPAAAPVARSVARGSVTRAKKSAPRGEGLALWGLRLSAAISLFVSFGIVFSVLYESFLFFEKISWREFFFGLHWSPQIAIRADQVAASGSFGMIPLLTGTLLISAVAMLVAAPAGLLAALCLSEFASARTRAWCKPALEMLAGVPTVVYGFFAAVALGPALRDAFIAGGFEISSESALAAGLAMGVMVLPFVVSLAEDALYAVPQSMRDGALALGATPVEAAVRVVLPAATPGVLAGMLLAASNAIGETMIVVMAAGLAANLTLNPLESTTTMTAQIVTLLTGDQEFDDPKTLAAFALGLTLFMLTLAMNSIALVVARRAREGYAA